MSKKDARNAWPKIKRLHKESGLKVNEYAERVGVSLSGMKSILDEINAPTIKTLCAISETHEVSLDWLCSDDD